MNKEDIIRMAREADLWMTSDERIAAVLRFAALVAAHEREACAKFLESISNAPDVQSYAEAIRARGEKC